MATNNKKSVATHVTKKKNSKSVMRSFVLADDNSEFFTFRLTHQTLYWIILSTLVLALGAWVLYLNARVESIYDQIQVDNASANAIVVPLKHK